MTLLLETGAGTRGANAYADVAFVTAYLAERNRSTEASWNTLSGSVKEAACISATDYIDTRWGLRFKGNRSRIFSGARAIAQFAFSANPVAAETFVVGQLTYTFVSALSEFNNNEILIGATVDDTVLSAIDAVNGLAVNEDVSIFIETNGEAVASLVEGSTTDLRLTASQEGSAGNAIVISEASTVMTLTSVFVNGRDDQVQPLEFPRINLFDPDGVRVVGVPIRLRQAMAEYAVRAAAASLYTDPTVDDTGRVVVEKFEKVGPIEERTLYEEGASLTNLIKPYPAADRLLHQYVTPAGRTLRG